MNNYNDYFSEDELVVSRKKFYTTRQGFPNRKAFIDFGEHLDGDYFLVCMSVDLRKANKEGYEYGSYVLRKFIISLIDDGYAVFHITGDKFNVLVENSQILAFREILEKEYEDFDIYYGFIIIERYTKEHAERLLREGIEKMYQHKAQMIQEHKTEGLIVRNTPPELQETLRRKFRRTTWYATLHITVTKPQFKTVTVYVFPTEYAKPLATVNTILVIDDMGEYRTYYDKSIEFGVGGVQFLLNCRFDRTGILNVAFFKSSEEGEYTHEIYVHKGECIPADFGKRAGNGREVYPIKKNINGFYDYVLLQNGEITLNTEGTIEMNSVKYGVFQDDDFIDLLPQV